jgi:PTH1 family peptidyl-tRNA hydrolase
MADEAPWLLVGLGNPGREYAHNRHNVGAMAVERWVTDQLPLGVDDPWREKFHGRYAALGGPAGRVVALLPQTYMNLSGKSVVAAAQFYRTPHARIIVVHDELDFEFGRVTVKNGGGHGGHNGLRDILTLLGSGDFVRIRTGIGRPEQRGGNVSKHVLSDFSAEERAELPDVLARAEAAATAVMRDGVAAAMNEFNAMPPAGGSTAIA